MGTLTIVNARPHAWLFLGALAATGCDEGVTAPIPEYYPLAVGNRWVYNETDEDGNVLQVEVTVTSDTKVILGITATVVHDVVSQDGEVIEDTFDWYAQDVDGNIWYMGEDTKEYEAGVVTTTEGSWQAGVDGAQAGILLPGTPEVGMAYRQEYYAGEAEDNGEAE